MTTVKTWAELDPAKQQKVRAYLDSHPIGKEITEQAGGADIDLDYALWLVTVELRFSREYGLSHLDLADNPWRDWFDSGMPPREATGLALEAEGLMRPS